MQASIGGGNYMTDAVFENMGIGLKFCDHPGENDSSDPNYLCNSPVERCQFLNCTYGGHRH